uniref:virulence factor TspB C-terminal domain-related protein n=1 Tax=Neptunomonas phycophila TaxID=1572645 RepID=UPI00355A3978
LFPYTTLFRSVSSSASCPEFPTVDTSYGSYSVDTTDNFCQYANTVRPFVIYMVSFFASLLVLRGITS